MKLKVAPPPLHTATSATTSKPCRQCLRPWGWPWAPDPSWTPPDEKHWALGITVQVPPSLLCLLPCPPTQQDLVLMSDLMHWLKTQHLQNYHWTQELHLISLPRITDSRCSNKHMFIAPLLTPAKRWKHSKCPLTDVQKNKMYCTFTVKC